MTDFYDDAQRFDRFYRDGMQVSSRLEMETLAYLDALLSKLYKCDAWKSGLLYYPKADFTDGRRYHKPDIIVDFDGFIRGGLKQALRSDGTGLLYIAVKPSAYPHLDKEFYDLHAVRGTHPNANLALVVGDRDEANRRYVLRFWKRCLAGDGCEFCALDVAA